MSAGPATENEDTGVPTDLEDIITPRSSIEILIPGFSTSSISHGMKVLQLQLNDINPTISTIQSFIKANEPSEFAELRHASHVRLCQSNKSALIKYLSEQNKRSLSKVSLQSSSSFIADATEAKIQHAHKMVEASKLRVRERALRKFKVERELEISKASLNANAEHHTNMLQKREDLRNNKILQHRENAAKRKIKDKIKNEIKLKKEQEEARLFHERETKERREMEEQVRMKKVAATKKLQQQRHDWRIKKNNEKKERKKQERKQSETRLAIALKRIDDTLEKDRIKKKQQEIHRQNNIEARKKGAVLKRAIVLENENKRQLVLIQIQKERDQRIEEHENFKKKEANALTIKIKEKDTKIAKILAQKEKMWKEHEIKMLHLVKVGNLGHSELKERKKLEKLKEALTQQLYRQEVQIKVERSKLLEEQNAAIIKEKIAHKEQRIMEMQEQKRHMTKARQKMERDTLVFQKKVKDVIDESIRTSNWDVKHQHRLFGTKEKDDLTEIEATTHTAQQKKKKKVNVKPNGLLKSPELRHQKHVKRWCRGHSEHDNLFHHIKQHDVDLHEDHKHIIHGKGGDSVAFQGTNDGANEIKPIRPSERLGASHFHRSKQISPRKRRNVKTFDTPVLRSKKGKGKHKSVPHVGTTRNKKQVVLPTSKEQIPWDGR